MKDIFELSRFVIEECWASRRLIGKIIYSPMLILLLITLPLDVIFESVTYIDKLTKKK